MANYSKQRAAILEVLKNTSTHPTAAYIYNEVRKELPNISLGTIYRNLFKLERAGLINKVAGNFEKERYDGDISEHAHFICEICGEIEDYPIDKSLSSKIMETCKNAKTFNLNYTGQCNNCLQNNKKRS